MKRRIGRLAPGLHWCRGNQTPGAGGGQPAGMAKAHLADSIRVPCKSRRSCPGAVGPLQKRPSLHELLSASRSSQRIHYVSCDLQVCESFLYVHRDGLKKKLLIEIKYSPTAEIFPSQVMRLTNRSLFCQRYIIVAHHLTNWSLYSSA